MIENILKYLQENKYKYTRSDLTSALSKVGYRRPDIREAEVLVYGTIETEHVNDDEIYYKIEEKKYHTEEEKKKDLMFGILSPWVLAIPAFIIDNDLAWIPFLYFFIALFYFKKRKKYVFKGLLWNFLIFPALIWIIELSDLRYFFRRIF